MKNIKKVSLILSIAIFLFACKKAGLGGDAVLIVKLKHHGSVIKNHVGYPDTVFVKFNTDELPGTTAADFDTYFVGTVGEDHVHCHGLKNGNYFLYGTGMDSAGPYRVTGGMKLKIKNSEKKDEINVELSVTE